MSQANLSTWAPRALSAGSLSSWAPRILSIMRIVAALLFLQHGMSKILGFPASSMSGHFHLFTLSGLGGLIELVCGSLMTIGLFTRIAAFIASGEMAFAYFMAHAPRSFFPLLNGGELAIMFCFFFLYIAFAGPGAWSFDRRR
jgi:putative oxidoreductase